MKYNVIMANAVRRAGRSEARWVGNVEADSQEEAERLAAERWPGPRSLTVRSAGGTPQHSSPPRGAE